MCRQQQMRNRTLIYIALFLSNILNYKFKFGSLHMNSKFKYMFVVVYIPMKLSHIQRYQDVKTAYFCNQRNH